MKDYYKYVGLGVAALLAFFALRPGSQLSAMIPAGVIPSAKAKELAQRFFTAMNHAFGTDNEEMDNLYNIVVQNPLMFRDISKAFGVRGYALGSEFSYLGEQLDLRGWICEELNFFELRKWKENIFSKI